MVHLIKVGSVNIGIDIGYSRIKVVLIENGSLLFSRVSRHSGNIENSLEVILSEVNSRIAGDSAVYGITGLSENNETACILKGVSSLNGEYGSLLEIGARKALFFDNLDNGLKLEIFSNSGCSAGTGSFFEEQASRLNISMNDLSNGVISDDMPKIAGRCSVFARTDIIHHQQEGRDITQILGGLSMAVAKSLKAHLIKSRKPALPILISGGLTLNTCFIKCIESVLDIPEESIIIREESQFLGAIGAALTAEKEFSINSVLKYINHNKLNKKVSSTYPPLYLFGDGDSTDKHIIHPYNGGELYMGIDIGSTSINLVLLDKKQNVIKFLYLRNSGKPEVSVTEGIKKMEGELNLSLKDIPACVTGSGRKFIAEKLGVELTKDEITAQAKGCLYSVPNVDTILEIGGQDSKIISVKHSGVNRFKMNKICAAGTGAFLEEQASQFDISMESFVKYSLKSSDPALMNERCTVFIEGIRSRLLAEGRSIEDICAGLCYAVVQNYLQRVAGNTDLGSKIVLQGGIAYNQGVVNGFRSITGKEIIVPDYFSVTGALGAALIAMESSDNIKKREVVVKDNFYETQFLKGYNPNIDPNKKTVGIPRVLFIHKLFPLFNQFFRSLNFNVILSDMNDPEIVALSRERSFVETCYPIKIAHGHVQSLINKKPDFIFIPSLLTMRHEGSKARKDSACIFMQTLGALMDSVFDFKGEGIELINPELNLSEGMKGIFNSLKYTGKVLGIPGFLIIRAIISGFLKFISFKKSLMKRGESIVKKLETASEPVFVVITRPYGVMDPLLNKGILKEVRLQGYKVITLEALPVEDYGLTDYPDMSWPFGQHILNGVEIVRKSENLQLIYVTNHGCGPDSVLSHYVEDIMDGKPYLNIEVDEHSSATGVKTRIEAFINSLSTGSHSRTKIIVPNIYPLNSILASIFKDKQIEITSSNVPVSEIEEGKEYATLSMLHSEFLNSVEGDSTIFIPRNEGSEVDGQYASFIIKKLKRDGFSNVKLLAPYLEDIPRMEPELFKKIWDSILLHDILNINCNSSLIESSIHNFNKPDNLVKTAYKVLESIDRTQDRVMLIGDPYILFHDKWLQDEIISPLKKGDFMVLKTPLAEMLYLMWFRSVNREECVGNLKYAVETLACISQIFGKAGPFTLDLNTLIKRAELELGMAQGGFTEYMFAKMKIEENRFSGIVRVSSMYDNGAMVTSLLESELTVPSIHIQYHSSKNAANIGDLNNMICLIENRKIQPLLQMADKEIL